MLKKYEYKILNLKSLKSKIGPFPRNKKVIMCHGVFDIVHPGHIRHLSYAKSKADILIASLTTDKHVKKGRYRPHVPENLRALNLAAFDMVDFVYIDNEEKPLNTIKNIKPDYFAKGYEYDLSAKFRNEATFEEENELKKYGGKIIFTPGDIVYSSTKILESTLPNLFLEKLTSSMENENLTFNDLRKSLEKISKLNVHVIGDTIIDTYTRTSMIGGQTKTPTLSVLFDEKTDYVGGAGIVAKHLNETGSNVFFTSVIGNDELGRFAQNDLKKHKINSNFIVDDTRPTTNKNLFIAENHRLLKVDTLDNRTISKEIQSKIQNAIKNNYADVVILSDFRHGIFNKFTIPDIVSSIPKNVFKVADSQVASRWGNITEYQDFDLITPNEKEARFALADQDSTVGHLSEEIRKKCSAKNTFLTLGAKGLIAIKDFANNQKSNYFVLDTFSSRVVDTVGSGDALLAYGSLVLKATDCILTASIIGSIAASCATEIDGNLPVSKDKIINKLNEIEKQL